jgi:hypothetical protein
MVDQALLQYDIGPAHFINITRIGSGWQVRELKGDGDEPMRLVHCIHRMEKDDAIALFSKMVVAAVGCSSREVSEMVKALVGTSDEDEDELAAA